MGFRTMKKILNRPYQQAAIREVEKAFRKGIQRVILVAHMGAGKTVMAAAITAKYHNVLWISHRRELKTQARQHCGTNVTSVTIQSMLDVAPMKNVDLIVWDECHHARAVEWEKTVVSKYPDVRMLGLTATPERPDGKLLGAIFGHMVQAIKPSSLEREGIIVPTLAAVPNVDSGRRTIVMRAEEAVNRYLKDGIAIVFAESVRDARLIAKRIGHGAECVTSETPRGVRHRALSKLKRGAIRVVTNVNILTEGVDLPAVSMVVLARNFGDRVTYVQAAARAGRAYPGKQYAMVVDLCDNVRRFGLPNDDHEYKLEREDVEFEQRSPTDPLPDPGSGPSPFVKDPYLVIGGKLIDFVTRKSIKETPILPCYCMTPDEDEAVEREVRAIDEEERKEHVERERNRYAENPEVRAKQIERSRKPEVRAKDSERRHTPEGRAKLAEYARKWRAENPEAQAKQLEASRKRYAEDPVFRAKVLEQARKPEIRAKNAERARKRRAAKRLERLAETKLEIDGY
jgi:DNA repair protein RadD